MAESLSYQRPIYLETNSPPPFKRFFFYCVFPATAGVVLLVLLHRNHTVPIRWFAFLLIAQAVLVPTFFANLNSTTRVDSDGLRLTLRIFGIPVYRRLVQNNRIQSLSLVASAADLGSLRVKYGVTFSPYIMVMMYWGTGVLVQSTNAGRILVGSQTPQALIDAIRSVQVGGNAE